MIIWSIRCIIIRGIIINNIHTEKKFTQKENFDDEAQKDFLKGAKIAYETVITDFSDNDNKIINSKSLLSEKIYDQFDKEVSFILKSKKYNSLLNINSIGGYQLRAGEIDLWFEKGRISWLNNGNLFYYIELYL